MRCARRCSQRLDHAVDGRKRHHAMGKSPHTGQDNAIRRRDGVRIGGDHNIFRPCSPECIADRLEIARAIIDEHNRPVHNIPLVDGMPSVLRGSISIACRRARARAL